MRVSSIGQSNRLAVVAILLSSATLVPAITLPTPASTVAASASRLGDLSAFRAIAQDTHARLLAGDIPSAKARIRDLETAWDDAEAGLKPRAAADWHAIDKAIDKALDVLRASKPEMSACRQAVTELLAAFDRAAGVSVSTA